MYDVGDVPLVYTRAVAFSIDLAVHVYISNYTRIASIRYRYIYVAGMHGYACIRVCLRLDITCMHAYLNGHGFVHQLRVYCTNFSRGLPSRLTTLVVSTWYKTAEDDG